MAHDASWQSRAVERNENKEVFPLTRDLTEQGWGGTGQFLYQIRQAELSMPTTFNNVVQQPLDVDWVYMLLLLGSTPVLIEAV